MNNGTLSPELRSQVLGFVLRGAPLDVVLTVLDHRAAGPLDEEQRRSVSEEYTKMFEIGHARDDYRRAAQEKALWLLSVHRQLARERGPFAIDTVDDIEPERFFEDYYFANRPVKIRGFAARWQDFSAWSVPRLLERFGDAEIEIMLGRDSHADYDEHVDKTRRRISFRDFTAMLEAAQNSPTNDFYMAARNLALLGAFGPLVDELQPLPGFLKEHEASHLNVWIGPAGTVTKLHHDLTNVLFMQLFGSKRITFVAPHDSALVYNKSGVIAQVDAEKPDYKKHPLFAGAAAASATVDPGDAIFIPVGWWHQVRSLSPSTSLTFINFARPNFFQMDDIPHFRAVMVKDDA